MQKKKTTQRRVCLRCDSKNVLASLVNIRKLTSSMLNPGSFVTFFCFDEVNSTCAYVMFQTTKLPVLLLLIKNVPEEAFI